MASGREKLMPKAVEVMTELNGIWEYCANEFDNFGLYFWSSENSGGDQSDKNHQLGQRQPLYACVRSEYTQHNEVEGVTERLRDQSDMV
mmetsp:Transcript_9448/g.18402  ORF Transcript_9448/g.18402 Transcript_9448/m.18402 type:complete len:89 (+) Transcript_9448:9-275(+)